MRMDELMRISLRWPARRMHLDERAQVMLSALAAVGPFVETPEWAPLAKKRPVIDPNDPSAGGLIRARFAAEREPGWVADPDDGYGNSSHVRLASPPASDATMLDVYAGTESQFGEPVEGYDSATVTHAGDAQWRAVLAGSDAGIRELCDLVASVPCAWADLSVAGGATDWRAVMNEVGKFSPYGSALWFAGGCGWDLTDVPADLVETRPHAGGTLLVARMAPADLGTATAMTIARALAAGAPQKVAQ